jgi:hypothetical protein
VAAAALTVLAAVLATPDGVALVTLEQESVRGGEAGRHTEADARCAPAASAFVPRFGP